MDDLMKFLKKLKIEGNYELTNAEIHTETEMNMPMSYLQEGAPPIKVKCKMDFKGDLKTSLTIR